MSDLIPLYLPMSTVLVLEAVKARLTERIPNVAVDLYPERPGDYRLNHPVAALLIGYSGSSYAKTSDTGAIAQQRELLLHITVVARKLNGTTGAISLVDRVRLALQGWPPPHCQPMWLTEDKYASETAGVWQHVIGIATRTMAVQADESVDLGVLTQVNYEE